MDLLPDRYRRVLVLIWVGLCAVQMALAITPLSTHWTRAIFLIMLGLVWVSTIALFWNIKVIRYGMLGFSVLALLFVALPGRSYDPVQLRECNVKCLMRYRGVRYYRDGESRFGINCSGLVRRGLINADYWQGIVTVNPRLVRMGLFLWWHDCTARQMGEGYRSLTRFILRAPSVNAVDPSRLLPGDLAATTRGDHVLAYLGHSTWIDADRAANAVIMVTVPALSNVWFNVPVNIMRWQQLE